MISHPSPLPNYSFSPLGAWSPSVLRPPDGVQILPWQRVRQTPDSDKHEHSENPGPTFAMKKKCNENEVILDFKLSEPHSYGFGLITEVHFCSLGANEKIPP